MLSKMRCRPSVDEQVLLRAQFQEQVLGLHVDLVGTEGAAEVAAGAVVGVAPGPVELEAAADLGPAVEQARRVGEQRNEALLGVAARSPSLVKVVLPPKSRPTTWPFRNSLVGAMFE